MSEIRTVLTEVLFTNLCKNGTIRFGQGYDATELRFAKADMASLAKGEIVTKEEDGKIFKFAMSDIGYDQIKEILRRSPIFSDMYYEL